LGLDTGAALDTLNTDLSGIAAIAFSPDGKQIAAASDDTTVTLFNLVTGTVRHTLRGHSDRVLAVVFSPDGKQIASASGKHLVLWGLGPGMEAPTKERRTLAKYLKELLM